MSIEAHHISKTFGAFKALDGVDLTVPTGELVALLGPSGSGKTTLLRIIAGLERPDSAPSQRILFGGEDVTTRHVRDRRVGFVFQHYALFRHMNVAKNIAFGLKVRPRRDRPSGADIRRKVDELLRLVQLDGLGSRYPHQLSGGQRQRVALARALATDPKVLLLDEPFGALDAKVRLELRTWLRRLHDEMHVTSVFVTHDQEEAFEVADRVVLMHRGRIEQEGSPHHLFHHPKTEFVVSFLGNVNRLHGRVVRGGVQVGDADFATPGEYEQGAEARVFIRPHDVDLHLSRNGTPALEAVVTRVHTAGPSVHVGLVTTTGQNMVAEVSHEVNSRLGLEPGNVVYAHPRQVRVFIGAGSPTGGGAGPSFQVGSSPQPNLTI